MNKKNKKNKKTCALLLMFITFISVCNNLPTVTVDSNLLKKQETETNINDSTRNNAEMINDVQITFSLVDSQVVLNQPVLLNLVIQNKLEDSIKLDLGQNYKEGFIFTIHFPNGKRVQLPQLQSEGISLIGDVQLKPQQIYSQKILLNEWTDFALPGNYTIKGRLINPFESENGKTLEIDSNFSVTLDVQPKDTEHLKRISAALVQRINQTTNYKENAETALMLSYVNDPVAVPYLEKALTSNKMIEPIIIKGLERIGSKNSVQALINIIDEKPKSEIASLAKFSLSMIERKSSDSEVKEMIRQFLEFGKKTNTN